MARFRASAEAEAARSSFSSSPSSSRPEYRRRSVTTFSVVLISSPPQRVTVTLPGEVCLMAETI